MILATSFFRNEIASLSHLAKKRNASESLVQRNMQRSRDLFSRSTPWPIVASGPLILIADAVMEIVEKKWRVVHLMLVRGIHDTHAVILPPLIVTGCENVGNWHRAFDSIEPEVRSRIVAVVSDGHKGILLEVKDRGWIIQRCHFHLLSRIQSRRSRFATARNREEAHFIFKHANIVLTDSNDRDIQNSLNLLEEVGWLSASKEIRNVLKGFVGHYKDFRSYLAHPELHLPTTSNTAESLASMVARLKYRLRGFRTFTSFTAWIIALFKFRRQMTCNGNQPN